MKKIESKKATKYFSANDFIQLDIKIYIKTKRNITDFIENKQIEKGQNNEWRYIWFQNLIL